MQFPSKGFEPGAEDAGDAGCVRRGDLTVSAFDSAASGEVFNNTYHKCRAEVSRDTWDMIWAKALAWAASRASANGWLPASRPPHSDAPTDRPIVVIGLVDDPMYRMSGDEPFRDVVAYWPEKKQWTVTHMGRGDVDAYDFPVKVKMWQPFAELPPPWSDLWKGTPA
jgi:hypothetical protein